MQRPVCERAVPGGGAGMCSPRTADLHCPLHEHQRVHFAGVGPHVKALHDLRRALDSARRAADGHVLESDGARDLRTG